MLYDKPSPYLRFQKGTLLAGLLAFVSGYVLVNHFLSLGTMPTMSVNVSDRMLSFWYFFSSHNVPIAETVSTAQDSGSRAHYDLISRASSPYFQFLYLIPPICLFSSGLISAITSSNTRTLLMSISAGCSIVLGYLPAVALTMFYFSSTTSAAGVEASIGADYVLGLLIAGLAYPLIFGAISGITYYISKARLSL